MSIKLKIIIFIVVLVIISLGITLYHLSFKEYKPVLKKEIVKRIDAQLNQVNKDVGPILEGIITDRLRYKAALRPLLLENEEVKAIIIYKLIRGNLYFSAISKKNKLIWKRDSVENVEEFIEFIPFLQRKRETATTKILHHIKTKTNLINSTITYHPDMDLKVIIEEERKKIQNILKESQSEEELNIKGIVKHISQSINKYSALYEVFNSLKWKEKTFKEIADNFNAIIEYDYPKLYFINEGLQKRRYKILNTVVYFINTGQRKRLNSLLKLNRNDLQKKLRYIYVKKQSSKDINKAVIKVIKDILSRLKYIARLTKKYDYIKSLDLTINISPENIKSDKEERVSSIEFYKPIIWCNETKGVYRIIISENEIIKKINPVVYNGIKSSLRILIISIIAALMLALYIVYPIHKLSKGADEITKDLKYRIKLKRKDEFGKLAKTFNRLASQLIEELTKYQKLYKEATEDGLTKLMVRKYFLETLKTELENARKEGRPTSLFMTDIDHFKKFNDTYGHQTGDIVLAKVAGVLLKNLRKNRVRNDIAGRYGGEEFAVLLPNTGKEEALKVAERIRREVEKMRVKGTKGEELHVTISIGVATSEDSNIEPEKLIERADKALYKSKEGGRNRVSYG